MSSMRGVRRVASTTVVLSGVAGLAAAAAAPALDTYTVERVSVSIVRELNGTIEAVNEATVSAQTSGRVGEILYDVNDLVPEGAVVLRLRGKEQRAELDKAEAAVQEAMARNAEAQARFERIDDMFERRVVPRATLDEALALRDSATAQVAAARAAVARAREGVSYTEVRAPYGGIVTQRHVEVGETVSPGTPLMSGLSLDDLRVVVDVPQTLAAEVRARQSAWVELGDARIPAEAITVFPVADPGSNTFRTRVQLPKGTSEARPGMFVKVVFVVGNAERLVLPESAVVERGELVGVYVVGADDRLQLRQVKVGRRHPDGRIEALAGLVEGERLVREPATALEQLRAAARQADG